MSDPIQTFHSINEICPSNENNPFTRVIVRDDEVFYVNPQSAWEVDRIYTDFVPDYEPHETLIVVFKRKNTEETQIDRA